MEISELDVADPGHEAALHRWWQVADAVDRDGRPWSWYLTWESLLQTFRTPTAAWTRTVLAAYDGGELVGGAHLQLPQLDNLHVAHVWVFVAPGRRRQGTGSMLLDRALAEATAQHRDTLLGAVTVPQGHEPGAVPGFAFAERHGFRAGISEGQKLLDLPATEPIWDALAAEAAPHHRDYRLVTWVDVQPAELVDGYCALNEAFNEEAPTGDLDVEKEVWDEARVRDRERVFRETGRHEVATAAVASDGTVAGLTEIMLSEFSPERALQGGTIVSPGHRGHRLGLAMKVANQRALRERFPAVRRVITGNADVNVHMNAVNDRLGFREVELSVEMQRKL